MDVTPLIRHNAQVIQSYKGGAFLISGKTFPHPVIVDIDHVRSWDIKSWDIKSWDIKMSDVSALTLDDFAPLFANDIKIDIVLLGTGSKFFLLPAAFRRDFKTRFGCSIDSMDTGAAARTFNVLMAEGRDVVAAMLPTE